MFSNQSCSRLLFLDENRVKDSHQDFPSFPRIQNYGGGGVLSIWHETRTKLVVGFCKGLSSYHVVCFLWIFWSFWDWKELSQAVTVPRTAIHQQLDSSRVNEWPFLSYLPLKYLSLQYSWDVLTFNWSASLKNTHIGPIVGESILVSDAKRSYPDDADPTNVNTGVTNSFYVLCF